MQPRHLLATALALILVVPACSRADREEAATGDAQVTEESPGLFTEAAIPPDSAVRIAKAHVPGQIAKAELEREDDVLIYSFDVVVAGQDGVTEVHVDAQTGTVLGTEHEGM